MTAFRSTAALAATLAAPLAAQTISDVTPPAAQRSDRIVVVGTGFGAAQGSSRLEIDGVPAIVTFWSDERIRAHVAEGTPLGEAQVHVVAGGTSNPGSLEVLARQGGDGHILWKRRVDHYYSLSRPAVAPDGTIYTTGVAGPLYSISPDGAVNWVFSAGGVRPPTVGPDGTVYAAGGLGSITALSPDGEPIWAYSAPSNAGPMFIGPSVGPDGKVYAVTEEEPSLGTDFGAFALEPDGSLAWSTSGGYNFRHAPSGWEIVFSNGLAFFATGQGFPIEGNPGVHALDTDSGQEQWDRVGIGKVQTDGGGNVYWLGAINNNYIGSYEPDGDQRWTIEYNQFMGQPGGYVVAPTGVSYYCTSTLTNVAAIEPDGSIRWQFRDFEHLQSIWAATPDGARFFGVAYPTDNSGPKFRLWDGADGSVIWEQTVPFEDDVWMTPRWEGALSPNGRVLYLSLGGNNYVDDPYSYFVAIDISAGGPCPADFNGDGNLNTQDVLAFLNSWADGDEAADFNGDGAVNTLDVLAFLNAWSAGC